MTNNQELLDAFKRLSFSVRDPMLGVLDDKIAFCNPAAFVALRRDPTGIPAAEIVGADVLSTQASEFVCSSVFALMPATVTGLRFGSVLVLTFTLPDKERAPAEIVPKSLIGDLRSHLGNLHMSVGLIIGCTEDSDHFYRYESTLYHSYYSMLRLITNLETINGLSAGDLAMSMRACDMGELCRDLVGSVSLLTHRECAAITYEGPDEKIISVVDREKIEQMLLNILSNCLLNTPRDGTISLSLKSSDRNKNMIISVNDTGRGISPDVLYGIFSHHDHNLSLAEIADGPGLGLNIAKGIAEKHGGSLMIQSEEGEGTKLAIKLPINTDSVISNAILVKSDDMSSILRELSPVLDHESYSRRLLSDYR